MRIRVYAVVCRSGEIHCSDEHCFVFLDKDQARDAKTGDDLDFGGSPDDEECGRHKIITLSGEVSLT